MSTKSIEKLIMLIVSAYIVEFLGSQLVYLYFSNTMNGLQVRESSELADFTKASIYQKNASDILSIVLNIVIAYWLYSVSVGKRIFWCALGLFSGWWALPLYAYYIHISKESESS